jgi:hypothetical protein
VRQLAGALPYFGAIAAELQSADKPAHSRTDISLDLFAGNPTLRPLNTMTGLLTIFALLIAGLIAWRLTRNDPLLTADGKSELLPPAEPTTDTDIGAEPAQLPAVMAALQKTLRNGLTETQVRMLSDRALRLDVDRQFVVQYQVPWRGTRVPLVVTVFRDDTLDITFYFDGPQSLIAALDTELTDLQNRWEK